MANKIKENAKKRFNSVFSTHLISHVEEIVESEKFLENPRLHMVNLMIERGVGYSRPDDSVRAFIIGQIPNFVDQVGSIDYLKFVGETRYQKHDKKEQIYGVLNRSLEDEKFKFDLKTAVEDLRKGITSNNIPFYAEDGLRTVLNVFFQAECLEHYHTPRDAGAE